MSNAIDLAVKALEEEIRQDERERIARLIEGELEMGAEPSSKRCAYIARNPEDAERLARLGGAQ